MASRILAAQPSSLACKLKNGVPWQDFEDQCPGLFPLTPQRTSLRIESGGKGCLALLRWNERRDLWRLQHRSGLHWQGFIRCRPRTSFGSADSIGSSSGYSNQSYKNRKQHVPIHEQASFLVFKPLPFPDVEGWLEGLSEGWRTAVLAGSFATLAAVAWFCNLAAAGLVDDTEPLFVEAARQMLLTRDWITPQFNAQPRFDKPALIYWLAAAAARVFGKNRAWAYRLPSAVCASLLMWGLVKAVRQFGVPLAPEQNLTSSPLSKKGSLISCIVVACAFALSAEVVVWGSIGVADMLLTSAMGACLLSFFYGYVGQRQGQFRWGYPLSAFFMGLSVLSKGPVGVVVPALVCATFLTYTGELLTVVLELPLLKGAVIVFGLNVPWYLAMVQRHGRMYLATFFGYHNLERFTKGVNHHDGMPFWFPSAVVLAAHLPWSLAVPVALLRSRLHSHRSLWLASPREDRLVPFAASWFLAVFGFFSLSASQLPSYYLPLSPAVALLAASLLTWREKRDGKSGAEEQQGVPPDVARLIAASTLAAYALQAVALSQLPAMLASSADAKAIEIGIKVAAQHVHWTGTAILGAGALAVTRTHEFAALTKPLQTGAHQSLSKGLSERKLRLPLWAVQAATGAIFLAAFFTPAYALFDRVRQQPLRQLAVTAASCQREGEPLCMVGPKMPSVVFYAQRPVAFFDDMKQATLALTNEAKPGVKSALLLGDAADMDGWPLDESQVATAGSYVLKRMFVPK